jgi:hypothetical protein
LAERERLAGLGAEPVGDTPEEIAPTIGKTFAQSSGPPYRVWMRALISWLGALPLAMVVSFHC